MTMKSTRTPWVLGGLLLILGGVELALGAPTRGAVPTSTPPQDAETHEDEETPLTTDMKILQSGLRGLRRSVRDPEKLEETLVALQEVQGAALRSKALVPTMAASVPEGERGAFIQAYRTEMIVLLEQLLAVEKAVIEGDVDGARALFKEVQALEDPGHERFTEDG